MKKNTIIMNFSGIYEEETFIKIKRSVGLTAEIFPGSTDIVPMMPGKRSEDGFRTMTIEGFISWTREIIII